MRIAIVDDGAQDAMAVEAMLVSWAGLRGIAMETQRYPSGEHFLEAFDKGRYELVFMDVYMSGIDGVETARRLRQIDVTCLLVFLTSSREHMAKAFPCHAFDYVDKPAQQERLFAVMDDAVKLLPAQERFLQLSVGHDSVRVGLEELVSAESQGNYLSLSLSDGRVLRQRMTFAELLRQLAGDKRFLSTIRGVILNMDYIDDLGERRCVMKTGAVFPVKVRDGAAIETALNRYRFDCLRLRQEGGDRA